MALKLSESIGDWQGINTAKTLRGCLLNAASRLRELGQHELAEKWEARIKRMRAQGVDKMDKEAINIVLLSANNEVKALGIVD